MLRLQVLHHLDPLVRADAWIWRPRPGAAPLRLFHPELVPSRLLCLTPTPERPFPERVFLRVGNHVIGTTSSDAKAAHLKSIGCDRVINYNTENVDEVLKKEYPNGVDLVFETVGGDLFRSIVDDVAVKGRVILFGYISGYHGAEDTFAVSELVPKLLFKSASLRGFISGHYRDQFHPHMQRLLKLINEKKLVPGIDPVKFEGLESIPSAIDYMYARKNIGKVVVKLA
ncbi:hypothetical protein PR002_g25869 [Phytophthora rubi]|uniref:Alcohol dehydrogenase-like C-terminal domain-containing protein n=2 Tax=Phytophthora rubi TaxID=129364 RepID=A0A6A3HYP9_9STRA|nr:hypothetical protein PR002_g25869 [Phytophthora rubi]